VNNSRVKQIEAQIFGLLRANRVDSRNMRAQLRELLNLAITGHSQATDILLNFWGAHSPTPAQIVREIVTQVVQERQAKLDEVQLKHQNLNADLLEAKRVLEKTEIVLYIQKAHENPGWSLLEELADARAQIEELKRTDKRKTAELRQELAQCASRLNRTLNSSSPGQDFHRNSSPP